MKASEVMRRRWWTDAKGRRLYLYPVSAVPAASGKCSRPGGVAYRYEHPGFKVSVYGYLLADYEVFEEGGSV